MFKHYEAVVNTCAYFSKAEEETSGAIKQTARLAAIFGNSNFEKVRTVARTHSTKQKTSVQEVVYLVMPEL